MLITQNSRFDFFIGRSSSEQNSQLVKMTVIKSRSDHVPLMN